MVRLPEYIQTRIFPPASRRPGQPKSQSRPMRASYLRRVTGRGVAGLALTMALAITGCATSPDQVVEEPTVNPSPEIVELPKETVPPAVTEPADKQPTAAQPNEAPNAGGKQPAAGEMVTVSVYTIDDQCNSFVEQPLQVPSGAAMDEAVGKAVAVSADDLNAFKLDGYQVNVDGSTAIVDMRLAPGSERQFVSLSSCEQRMLFGSVEETLLNNADWDVDAVKFTTAGKELML